MVFSYLYMKITLIHNHLMNYPILTEEHLNKITSSNVFAGPIYHNHYRDLIYLIGNIFDYIIQYNNPVQDINYKKIIKIHDSNNTEYIEKKLSYIRSIPKALEFVKSNEFMKEIIEKTNKITKNSDDYYLNQYVAGNCWVNSRLSHNFELYEKDKLILECINSMVERVEPLSYPIQLFHGFEKWTNYGNPDNYKIGDIINIPGLLSKSLSLNISYNFAICENYFRPKFLVVMYPKGSKQIHFDARIFNTEFEFLTKSNEKLVLREILWYYQFPKKLTFYVCEPI